MENKNGEKKFSTPGEYLKDLRERMASYSELLRQKIAREDLYRSPEYLEAMDKVDRIIEKETITEDDLREIRKIFLQWDPEGAEIAFNQILQKTPTEARQNMIDTWAQVCSEEPAAE